MSSGLGFGKRKLIDEIIKQNWSVRDPREKKDYSYTELLFIIQEMLTEEGRFYAEGQNINRGFEVFRNFAKMLVYRNLANYDTMVLITSEKGSGKSSFAMMLAREICKIIGIKFDPEVHMAYNNAEVSRKIDELPNFSPIVCDESVRFMSSEDWARCISGDSLIHTPKGKIKIKDLAGKENFELYSFNEKDKKIEVKIAEKCVKTKKDVVYEIETEDGLKIKATKEHKFLTKDGWKELKDLKVGDDLFDN